MSSIEVIINGVTQSVSKQQLFSMAAQGIINSQTPIMVNGKLATAGQVKGIVFGQPYNNMGGQVPHSPFTVPPTMPPLQPYAPLPARREYRDPGTITFLTILFTAFCLIGDVIEIPVHIVERAELQKIRMQVINEIDTILFDVFTEIYKNKNETIDDNEDDLDETLDDLETEEISDYDLLILVYYIVKGFIELVAGILFLIWTYRIVKNAHYISYRPLRYSPGWAVISYFIPIWNLFRPFTVLSDAHKASKNPGNWTVASGCVLMGWWWGAYILSSCLNICFWAQDMIENVDTLLLFNTCNIFFHLTIWPFANILALLVVKEVCRCQQEAYQQLHSSTGPVPISPFPVQSFPQQPMGYQQGWWQQHY